MFVLNRNPNGDSFRSIVNCHQLSIKKMSSTFVAGNLCIEPVPFRKLSFFIFFGQLAQTIMNFACKIVAAAAVLFAYVSGLSHAASLSLGGM